MTLAELLEISEGRQKSQWAQTALLAALIHNTSISSSSEAADETTYNPFAAKRGKANRITADSIGLLKPMAGGNVYCGPAPKVVVKAEA